MKKYVFFSYLGLILFLTSCVETKQQNLLHQALASTDLRIKKVMDSLEHYEVQIMYTQIDRRNDSIFFTDYDFQVNSSNYFYPASTVTLPIVIASLEKLNELETLGLNTTFYIEGDTTTTTFKKTIEEVFTTNDTNANNRLIEFLGFNDLNIRMQKKGVNPIRIGHRLSTTDADNSTTKPLVIYINDSTTATTKPIINTSAAPLTLNRIKKGNGFYMDDFFYQEPFDFSLKNHFPITSQHELLKRIIFRENFSKEQCFNLSEDQHNFLLSAMRSLPKATEYNSNTLYDSGTNFFMYGDSKESTPNHINIYNKAGCAYGTLTECAYIKDRKNNIDFMLTASILVNKDRIYNNDTYEYDEVGIPFLAQLGRELYELELNRNK